jgi:uncharacterized protein (DUF1800 family)
MSKAHIALNRFGYGLARGQQPPGDARSYLLRQLDAFDPAPGPIASRRDTRDEPAAMLAILRRNRQLRAGTMGPSEPAMAPPEIGQRPARGTPSRGAIYENPELAGLPADYRAKIREAFGQLRDDVATRTNVAVASPAPMVERLVHFWSNHFSVSAQKPGTPFMVGPHEFDAIRPHVLGRFSDMLKAAVLHPAMLLYLDQFQSVGPNSRFQRLRARRGRANGAGPSGLNENLAREVLELHTLGVDGGYDQQDVTELARALTGWTVAGIERIERFSETKPHGAAFVAFAHEPGTRRILGRSYGDNGAKQAEAVLDDLATTPATARFIATKLARHFGGDVPPPGLVTALEGDFLRTGGDLASLARTLIDAPEMWKPEPVKFRQPFEWLVSALRLSGVANLDAQRLSGALNEIGQVPWRAPSPAGYDDLEGSWAGPDALYRRVELAERIARNVPAGDVLARAEAAFPGALSDHTRSWLARAESGSQALGLLLVSPEMMRR